jgi:hypothetical protein
MRTTCLVGRAHAWFWQGPSVSNGGTKVHPGTMPGLPAGQPLDRACGGFSGRLAPSKSPERVNRLETSLS